MGVRTPTATLDAVRQRTTAGSISSRRRPPSAPHPLARGRFYRIPQSIEVLPLADASFLDCGGAISSFSPFAECDATAPARCMVGTAIIDVRLVDRAGNESAPFRVTITFQ